MNIVFWIGIPAILVGGFFLGREKERQRLNRVRRSTKNYADRNNNSC